MKSINKIIFASFCSLLIISCSSSDDDPMPVDNNVEQIVELPDSVKQHIIKQDSLYSGLIAKIDTLTAKLNSANEDVATLQKQVESLKSPSSLWNYLTIAALVISLISIILHFFVKRGLEESEIEDLFKKYLGKSTRYNDLKNRVDNLEYQNFNSKNNKNMPKDGSQNKNVDVEIKYLNNQVKQLENRIEAIERPKVETIVETSSTKVGYAKLNSDKYFLDILSSKQEGCVFQINFKNKFKGEFDIISLDKIKSRNGWQDVIETTGDCMIEDATSYKVLNKGVCEKLDDKTWEVKNKLKIKISK